LFSISEKGRRMKQALLQGGKLPSTRLLVGRYQKDNVWPKALLTFGALYVIFELVGGNNRWAK